MYPDFQKFTGGDGESIESAVEVNLKNTREGVAAEYYLIELNFGKPNVDWYFMRQELLFQKGKHFDKLSIVLSDGEEKELYFNIEKFYGKS